MAPGVNSKPFGCDCTAEDDSELDNALIKQDPVKCADLMWKQYTQVLGLNRWLTNAEEAAVSKFLVVCSKCGYMTKLLQGKQEYGFPASL